MVERPQILTEEFEILARIAAREIEGLRLELIGGKLGVKAMQDGITTESFCGSPVSVCSTGPSCGSTPNGDWRSAITGRVVRDPTGASRRMTPLSVRGNGPTLLRS